MIYTDGLVRASCPEEAGVDTYALRDFFNELKEKEYRFKNIMVLRNGKIAAECTRYPYVSEMPHTMFSFSKAITAIAIGFAINEGLLRLDTTVEELFSDSYSEKLMKKNEGINVRNLLNMTAGKSISLLDNKAKGKWLDSFLKSSSYAKPDEKFKYISENTYVLGRMLGKVSGLTISEYLKTRLFEPLGIEVPFWEKDELGFDAGGWGIFLTIEDMAKIGQCFLQNGVWNGIQVIPDGWVEAMTTPYRRDLYGLDAQELGFGFCTWCGRDDGYFRFEGLYSQFAFFYPREQACVVINCSDIKHKVIFDLVDKYFPAAFKDNLTRVSEDVAEDFRESLKGFSYNILPVSPRNFATEKGLNGKVYGILPMKAATLLPLSSTYMLSSKPGKLNNISFNFKEDYAEMSWEEENAGKNVICINFDGKRRISNVHFGDMHVHVLAYGAWREDGKLEIQFYTMEIPEVRTWVIDFSKKKIRIKNTLSPNLYETLDNKYRFEGMKTNIILDLVARISNFAGNLIFVGSLLIGRQKKVKEDEE